MRKEAQKNILNYTKLIFCIIEGGEIIAALRGDALPPPKTLLRASAVSRYSSADFRLSIHILFCFQFQ